MSFASAILDVSIVPVLSLETSPTVSFVSSILTSVYSLVAPMSSVVTLKISFLLSSSVTLPSPEQGGISSNFSLVVIFSHASRIRLPQTSFSLALTTLSIYVILPRFISKYLKIISTPGCMFLYFNSVGNPPLHSFESALPWPCLISFLSLNIHVHHLQ